MRLYQVKNKKTDQYLLGTIYSYGFGNDYNISSRKLEIIWGEETEKGRMTSSRLAGIIHDLVFEGQQSQLDDCEIEAFDVKHIPVKGNIKLSTLRQHLEQQIIIEKLKG